MSEPEEFRFEIRDLTPTTLSMKRLQDYVLHLVELFGNHDDVHLLRIEDGSAVPCIHVNPPVVSKVEKRLLGIKTGAASRKSFRAVDGLNELLAEDRTSAVLRAPHFGVVIEFPGNARGNELPVGPISETCEVQGELFQLGGRDETISIYLRDEGNIFICSASREQGREISKYLFKPVRVSGNTRWARNENGRWRLVHFKLRSFRPLNDQKLSDTVETLRKIGRSLDLRPDLSCFDDDED